MSSSDGEEKRWGTIYMGPGPMDEATISDLEGTRRPLWDERTEAEYMERVQAKAAARVCEMLEEARREADALRARAREEGYAAGLDAARAELDEFRAGMGDSVSAVLQAIQGQCSSIFAVWREELVELLKACVERYSGVIIAEERATVLRTLFAQAVQALDSHRQLVIRVNPEDESAVADMVQAAKERLAGLEAWTVRGDASMAPGGLVVESDDGMVDNRIETRRAVIEEVLAHLTLPPETTPGAAPDAAPGNTGDRP